MYHSCSQNLKDHQTASAVSHKFQGKQRFDVQVTSHQLRQQKEADKQAAAEEAKRRDLAAKREVQLLCASTQFVI